MHLLRLTERTDFGDCASSKPVTLVQRVGSSANLEKTTVGSGGFFFIYEMMNQSVYQVNEQLFR
ncbi:hypothetical protein CHH35_29305 [Escherichia coli O157:H7]|nr:hypothetical protein CHH35_29305 [Escherichia coli O157:H7]